jgi:hypothetical protein
MNKTRKRVTIALAVVVTSLLATQYASAGSGGTQCDCINNIISKWGQMVYYPEVACIPTDCWIPY